jgi:hypothetical protein
MKAKTKKQTRGGARTNAGAPPKYTEPTTMVSFRCPKSRVPEFRAWGHKKLNEFKLVKQ